MAISKPAAADVDAVVRHSAAFKAAIHAQLQARIPRHRERKSKVSNAKDGAATSGARDAVVMSKSVWRLCLDCAVSLLHYRERAIGARNGVSFG